MSLSSYSTLALKLEPRLSLLMTSSLSLPRSPLLLLWYLSKTCLSLLLLCHLVSLKKILMSSRKSLLSLKRKVKSWTNNTETMWEFTMKSKWTMDSNVLPTERDLTTLRKLSSPTSGKLSTNSEQRNLRLFLLLEKLLLLIPTLSAICMLESRLLTVQSSELKLLKQSWRKWPLSATLKSAILPAE